MEKAKEVFVRLAAEDLVITKEEYEKDSYGTDCTYYLIGFEDIDGNECDEDGNYLEKS